MLASIEGAQHQTNTSSFQESPAADDLLLPTVVAKVALFNLPSQVKTLLPELTVEGNEPAFYESKYQIKCVRTYRTLLTRFSNHSEEIINNQNLSKLLNRIENIGWEVQSEKLFGLKEKSETHWIVCFEQIRIKMTVMPSQLELSSIAPKLVNAIPFESAFETSLKIEQNRENPIKSLWV